MSYSHGEASCELGEMSDRVEYVSCRLGDVSFGGGEMSDWQDYVSGNVEYESERRADESYTQELQSELSGEVLCGIEHEECFSWKLVWCFG